MKHSRQKSQAAIHRTDFQATISLRVTVEFEAFPESPGTREGGTGLLLSPPDPAYIDLISVKIGDVEIKEQLSKDDMQELEAEISESLAEREP